MVDVTTKISKITSKDDEALEYLRVLVSVELAAEMHRDAPNRAIRKAVARQLPSITFDRVRSIFVGLTRQAYPVGCLEMLRRELEESLS